MARFTIPRDVYYGKNALDELKTINGKKAIVVVGGGSMKKAGFLDKVVNNLKEAGLETLLFENVEPDPSITTVMNGAKAMNPTGLLPSAAAHRLTRQKPCGCSMNIPTQNLKTPSNLSACRPFAPKRASSLFPQLPEQRRK